MPVTMPDGSVHPHEMSEKNQISDDISTKTKSFQKWVCLVWKMIPHPVASFCTHPRPPSGHIGQKSKNIRQIGQKSAKSPPPIGAGQPPIGAGYPSTYRLAHGLAPANTEVLC